MSSSERNTEIWSTRLQRELLAMTTDNVTKDGKDGLTAVLPAFCIIREHALDIERGNCTVTCLMDLPPGTSSIAAKSTATAEVAAKAQSEASAPDDSARKEETEGEAATEGSTPQDTEEKEIDDGSAKEVETVAEGPALILVTLDVSCQKKSDGSVDASGVSYPFLKPIAILTSGCNRFPEGSTIKDGDCIDIEMDWTPSLHLADAFLNLALKIKECISQGEPFHAGLEASKMDVSVSDMMNRAKRLGSSFSQSLRGLTDSKSGGEKKEKKNRLSLGRKKNEKKQKPKATNPSDVRIGDEINMLEAPWVDCQGVYSCKAIHRPKFVEEAVAAAAQQLAPSDPEPQVSREIFEDFDQGEVPEEFGDYMRLQAGSISQVATAGFAGAGAMLRSITTTARSVLEESFLMVTESHIIEMRSNKLNLSTGIVTFAIPIELMAKLKFRRQESVSLFFKPAPDDALIYMCPDSADCVHQIQTVLKRHGVKGKHTNAATHRAINHALLLVQEIQTKELALKHDPSVERVNEIMDLYRQAAERFEVAGDVRHEEVVTHMRKFLALPLTISILDGSYKKPVGDEPISTTSGEGVVLISPNVAGEADGPGETAPGDKSRASDDDKAFEANMDSILREAEADLANMKLPDDDDPELDAMLDDVGRGGSADDAIADFENMLKEADNELAELMNS